MKTKTINEFFKEITFFRPALKITEIPSKINVNFNPTTKNYSIDKKIKIKNVGDGTAIISVVLYSHNDTDFEKLLPKSMDTFVSQVFTDIELELNEIKDDFPNYSPHIDEYLSLTKPPIIINNKFRWKIKSVSDHLLDAFDENEDFFEAFSWAIGTSYLKNLHLVTEIKSFINYINSIGEGKVLLWNYIDVLKPKKSMATLELEIQMTDLAYRNYPSLKLPPIKIMCKEESCEIPIHMLFDWASSSG